MYNFKSLVCYNCKSVIMTLSDREIAKMKGLNFLCECCGHQNLLSGTRFNKSTYSDPTLNIYSYENIYSLR